ncbi:MAG: hypothetical protein EA401_06085 [Planctomycetota bacterium]|nr:MAG: hypothetical protein EA401_06085 [Planctomycetota bacterium]
MNLFNLPNAYLNAGGDCRDQAYHDLSQIPLTQPGIGLRGLPDARAGLAQPALDRINQHRPLGAPLMNNPFGNGPFRSH